VWMDLLVASLQAQELTVAEPCALALLDKETSLVQGVVQSYEQYHKEQELELVLRKKIKSRPGATNVFTELGLVLVRHHPSAVLEYVQQYGTQVDGAQLMKACEQAGLWQELVLLQALNKLYDQAVETMLRYPTPALELGGLIQYALLVNNTELLYQALHLYYQEYRDQLQALLLGLQPRLDPNKVVELFESWQGMALLEPYLVQVLPTNTRKVNEAYFDLLIQAKKPAVLQEVVAKVDNFDASALAERLEHHPELPFRRIAVQLLIKVRRWKHAMALAKQDAGWQDAMQVAHHSQSVEMAEHLLEYFAEKQDQQAFAKCLETCYDYVRPETALHLAWSKKWWDLAVPYFARYLRQSSERMAALEHQLAALQVKPNHH